MRAGWPLLLIVAGCSAPADKPLQGYIEGEYVRVAAPFAGTLQQLGVARGSDVAAGAPLFSLERENELAARRQAQQQLDAALARLANLQSGKRPSEVEMVSEQLRQAMASRELSQANLKRQEQLAKSGFISGAALDDARTAVKRDEASVAQLKASVATANLPARPDEIRAAQADAAAARDALAQADWKLGQRAVAAPVAARVSDTYYVVGDWVPAGGVVVNLLPAANVKIRFYVPEPELGALRTGQAVRYACDGCGSLQPAMISFIADRAEFTPPYIYSKDNRSKFVFLVEARPAAADAPKLNPGQPVDVWLH